MKHQFGPFWHIFRLMTSPRGVKNWKWLWFQKVIIHLKFPFAIEFHLSITIGTWNTSWALFHPILFNDIIKGVKIAIFWERDLRSKLHLQSFVNCWFQSFYPSQTLDTSYTALVLFYPTLQKKYIFQNFEKLTKKLDLIS